MREDGVILDADGNPVLGADGKPLIAGSPIIVAAPNAPAAGSRAARKAQLADLKRRQAAGKLSVTPDPPWNPGQLAYDRMIPSTATTQLAYE